MLCSGILDVISIGPFLQVLPESFSLPSPPYLAILVAGMVLVVGLIYYRKPRVTERDVIAFAPWMIVGASLRVLHVIEGLPEPVNPFFGTPAVYMTVFVVSAGMWVVLKMFDTGIPVAVIVGVTGSTVAVVSIGLTFLQGLNYGGLMFSWPFYGLLISAILTGGVWFVMLRRIPKLNTVREAGPLVLLGHTLDGVSTAIGIDVLGLNEQTPMSRVVLEFASTLPTASLLGSGWLFVVIKVSIAALIVWLFVDFVREEPTQGYILLGIVAAVGLGPGVHNLLLFTIGG
ncbi:MAG: DUF63 family protein [Halobacteria archaeon]|nr:DUF63 family protein [Halobacteria archaeon]